MSETNSVEQQRRKVVVLSSSIAALSGILVLLKDHRVLLGCWIAVMVFIVVLVLRELAKLKRMQG